MKTTAAWILAWICGSWTLAAPIAAQCQVQKLIPSDTQQGDEFGFSVSISGTTALIGARGDDDVFDQSGAAYVYELRGSVWVEVQKLKALDVAFGTGFGGSVAVSGDWAVIGACDDSPLGLVGAGSVYVFQKQGGIWVQTQKLIASDAMFNADFGDAVAIDGPVMCVGARQDGKLGYLAGAAYLYELQGSTWVEVAALRASDFEPSAVFGGALAVSDDIVLVGASGEDNGAPRGSDFGAAYVFERQGNAWLEVQKLVASDGAPGDLFGIAVASSQDSLMVSSVSHDSVVNNLGAVYVFEKQGASWVETQQLTPLDPQPSQSFGVSVGLGADLAIIGSYADQDLGITSGSAYCFRRLGGLWIQAGKLLATEGDNGDVFGFAVALDGETSLVGARGDEEACPTNPACLSGSAYLFQLAPDTIQYGSCNLLGPCGNHDDHGGCVNSAAQGAVLAACGSGSVTTDDLRLEGRWLPPGVFGIVFMGPIQVNVPFGDGRRIVGAGGGSVYRYPAKNTGAAGVLPLGPGIVTYSQLNFPAAGQIQAGQIWSFQGWYRDPNGPCGKGFNLTNGVSVSFTP